ncbi:MAG TPA: ATPase domain-containing protein [Myxococcales bacterium]|nr:ATPase domain-containing protein [Myxococcales bacterium]
MVSTGIDGLDDILAGGLPPRRLYLVQGDPGSGKTTLGLQFLLEGRRRGESVLYVSLSETRDELLAVAASHGMDLGGVPIFELAADDSLLRPDQQNTLFEPSEVELSEVTRALLAEVERVKPSRVVFDSLSELRLLSQSALRYRRQLLSLKQHFAGRRSTVLLMDDRTSEAGDLQLQSLAHGVIELEQLSPVYGTERRRLRVAKMRGVAFRGGNHDFRIVKGGLQVYVRLVAAEYDVNFTPGVLQSGVPHLDEMLGGGLDRGTSALLLGPAGSGKSALALQYAGAAARRGDRASCFLFDESLPTFVQRSTALGVPVERLMESGSLAVRQVNPAEMSPGELISRVREDVERRNATMVVIDSLNGYLAAMPGENFLVVQLHELLSYLRQRGVVCILVVAQAGLLGTHMVSPVDVSYLADTVLMLRYFEARGQVHKALSVLKRRSGRHSTDIRELIFERGGLRIGAPLADLDGVLTGVPRHLAGGT